MPLDSGLQGSSSPEASPRACIFSAEIRRRNLLAGYAGKPACLPGWMRFGGTYCEKPDGRLVYCGQHDGMLKVSGMAVSPSEIEGALKTHPGGPESGLPKTATGRIHRVRPPAQGVATGRRA